MRLRIIMNNPIEYSKTIYECDYRKGNDPEVIGTIHFFYTLKCQKGICHQSFLLFELESGEIWYG
jgi:hypothetical protein